METKFINKYSDHVSFESIQKRWESIQERKAEKPYETKIKYTEITEELDDLLRESRLFLYKDRDIIAHNIGNFLCFDYNDYIYIKKDKPIFVELSNIDFVNFISKYCSDIGSVELISKEEKQDPFIFCADTPSTESKNEPINYDTHYIIKDEMGYCPDQERGLPILHQTIEEWKKAQPEPELPHKWINENIIEPPLEEKHAWINEERIRECCGKYIEEGSGRYITVTPDILCFFNYYYEFLKSVFNCKKIEPMPESEIQKWMDEQNPVKKERYNVPYPLLAGILD